MMLDRLEYIRSKIDIRLSQMDEDSRKYAIIHLYGVSQYASMLALQRGLDVELSAIAGMLHDIAQYQENIYQGHAERSGILAKELLMNTGMFQPDEITIIVQAIHHHSDKTNRHGPYDELLKDADVLQHYFYHPNQQISASEQYRLYYLLEAIKQK